MKKYLFNEDVWLDPSHEIVGGKEIRSLQLKQVEVRNRPGTASPCYGSFMVSEPPGSDKCSLAILFSNIANFRLSDYGSQQEIPEIPAPEKVFLTEPAIDLIRRHPLNIPQVDYLLELPPN